MFERLSTCVFLLGLFVATPAASAVNSPARLAVVIGNNHSNQSETPDLRYADDDAVATHQLLVQAGVDSLLLTAFDDDTARLNPEISPTAHPSKHELEKSFSAVSSKIQSNTKAGIATELLFFYSGHGDVRNGEGYVVLEGGELTRTELYTFLKKAGAARNHVLVDACKSYYLAFDRGPGGHREHFEQPFTGGMVPARLTNTGFVLSTSSARESHEWERLQSGILSHELRSALRGAADVDQDGRITYGELGAFIRHANKEIVNPSFRPDVMVLAPSEDLEQDVLRWPDTAPLHLAGTSLGHIYVEDARGHRILDAHPAAQQGLTLHVPAERPLFVRQHDGRAEYVVNDEDPVFVASLDVVPQVAAKGALHLAFEKLFASPFGTRDVQEFEHNIRLFPIREQDARSVQSSDWQTLSRWSGAIAIGAGVGAASLGLLSTLQYHGAPEGTSQLDLEARYRSGKGLWIGSLVLGGIAGAAGITWGATKLWPDVTVATNGSPAAVYLNGRF